MNVERFNEYQAILQKLYPDQERDISESLGYFFLEVEEVRNAQTRENLIEELGDTIISAMGVLTNLGADVEGVLNEKLGIAWNKYNPHEVHMLQARHGWTREQACEYLKERYNGSLQTKPPQHNHNEHNADSY